MALKDLVPWGDRQGPAGRRAEDAPLRALQRQMNELIGSFSRGWLSAGPMANMLQGWEGFAPRVDVVETDQSVEVTAELPGMSEKDIELSVSQAGDLLTVRGQKTAERSRSGGGVHHSERFFGSFTRHVALP